MTSRFIVIAGALTLAGAGACGQRAIAQSAAPQTEGGTTNVLTTTLPAPVTNLAGGDWGGPASQSAYELSHREENHSFVTADGVIHLLINTGSTDGQSLELVTSIDGGATWSVVMTFPGTDNLTTNDAHLAAASGGQQTLRMVFNQDVGTTALMYAQLTYTIGSGWSAPTFTVIDQTAGQTYSEPSLAIDRANNLWVADSEGVTGSWSIPIYQNVNGVWQPSGIQIPNPINGKVLHGPHLAAIAPRLGNVGLYYQTVTCLYWTTISGTTAQSPFQLSCGLNSGQPAQIDTAFSAVTDGAYNQYVAYTVETSKGGEVTLARSLNAATNTWSSPQQLGVDGSIYAKASLIHDPTGTKVSMVVSVLGSAEVFLAPALNGGPTPRYVAQDGLAHGGIVGTFTNPRMEVPERVDSTATQIVPIWEQYTTVSPTQSLVYWAVPFR